MPRPIQRGAALSEQVVESLPLTETTFLILLSLTEQPRHGYAIMKDIERISEKRVQLSTGTLYGALRRLLKDRWIERISEEQVSPPDDERDRNYYQLTGDGRKALRAEAGRMRELLQAARLRGVETPA